MSVNGTHTTNGVLAIPNSASQSNGNVPAGQQTLERPSSAQPGEKIARLPNGLVQPAPNTMSAPEAFSIDMLQLPSEIREMLALLPDDVYVPMGTLVRRVTQRCWSDLLQVLEDLSAHAPVPDLLVVDRMMPAPDTNVKNDTSLENRSRKLALWEFAMKCRNVLTKLHVLMQWASKGEENKLTIALNLYIHTLRKAYSDATQSLVEWLNYMVTRQDAAPDLDTAFQTLAAGRIAGLPELGYAEQKDLTPRQMLSTLRRLNSLLAIRMAAVPDLPTAFTRWEIHDGRVTLTVPGEFELDASIMSEDVDAVFLMVDLRFDFTPAPMVSQELLDQITTIVNGELAERGLQGAYNFIHELVLTQKLKELHNQAMRLRQGVWTGHLQVELLKRTLIVQYWARRTSGKSWIEITLESGRSRGTGVPFINLRWMRHGKLVTEHDIDLDLAQLSFESVLNQVVAQHTNFLFENIYDTLAETPFFRDGNMSLEVSASVVDAFDCGLSIDISKRERIRVTCDPVSGSIVLSPASDRAGRFQYDISRSKDITDEFLKRFSALRCALNQAALLKAIENTSWIRLAGRKPSFEEVKDLFEPNALRAVFFKQKDWPTEWSLAAVFGNDGDHWRLVYEPENGKRVVQRLHVNPLHLQSSLSFKYFEELSCSVEDTINVQITEQAAERRRLKTATLTDGNARKKSIKIQLDHSLHLASLGPEISVTPFSSQRVSERSFLVVLARLRTPKDLLQRLAAAGLDSSIKIDPEKRVLMLKLPCAIGENLLETILARLRYVHDLLSCIRLVHASPVLVMQDLTLNSIAINYHTRSTGDLGVELLLDPPPRQSRIRLLPAEKNPHSLVAEHLDSLLAGNDISLAKRLQRLLCTLMMTLPLMDSLQYLQGQVTPEDVPEMTSIDLEGSRQWIKVHVLIRDAVRFGVHFFATNPNFRRDAEGNETPQTMLLRLEILPHVSQDNSKLAWLIRPAIEEFQTYQRPSYTNKELKERIKERILSNDNDTWIALDSATTCEMSNPYGLIAAFHTTLLKWLQEAVASKAQPQTQAVPSKMQAVNQPNAAAQANTSQTAQQRQQTAFQQGRPRNMSAMNNAAGAAGGTGRVMTAPPQQIRQPMPNQRRPGQNQAQNRNNHQQRAVPGPQHDVINLD